jgi:hypothetical protein
MCTPLKIITGSTYDNRWEAKLRAIQETGEAATPSVSTDSPAKHPTDVMGPHIGKGKEPKTVYSFSSHFSLCNF